MTNARFFNEIVHPEDRPVVAAAWATAAQTGEFDADFRVWRRTADGGREVRWVTGRARRLPADGKPGRIYGVNVDIRMRRPRGSCPGQRRRAVDSLTMATRGVDAESRSSKKRPRTRGVRITSK